MSSKFFSSIIDDEKVVFGVKNESLKSAAKNVAKSYSRNALNTGTTYLDYNNPPNRCAYLYKYGAIHTALVTKFFRKLIRKKQVKALLQGKKELRIVCLGGGPGTDVIGIFKALSALPSFLKKVSRVTILDICGGWRNSFKRIMGSICSGEVKDLPATFIDSNMEAELISVDLLGPLPSNVIERLSSADIVCMVKFVSAILGKPSSIKSLQVIGENLKPKSVVLFVDRFEDNVSKQVKELLDQVGLQLVMGPLDEKYPSESDGKWRFFSSKEQREIFDCIPQISTRVSVMGFMKTHVSNCVDLITECSSVTSACEDDCYVSEGEFEDSLSSNTDKGECRDAAGSSSGKLFCQTFTETETQHDNADSIPYNDDDLNSLLISLRKFLDVLTEWKDYTSETRCCKCNQRL